MTENNNNNNSDNKSGLPTKEQLAIMLQRYSSVQFVPLDGEDGEDNDKKDVSSSSSSAITVQSETAKFKKPIFMGTDCGNIDSQLLMAMQHQAALKNTNSPEPSRVILQGNLSLVQKAISAHQKLLGDDPYNPNRPFENDLMLMTGDKIPEYDLTASINNQLETNNPEENSVANKDDEKNEKDEK